MSQCIGLQPGSSQSSSQAKAAEQDCGIGADQSALGHLARREIGLLAVKSPCASRNLPASREIALPAVKSPC